MKLYRFMRLKDLEKNYKFNLDSSIINRRTGKQLKPFEYGHGYLGVALCLDGKYYKYKVHEIVAYKAGLDVVNKTINHIDGNKRNNNHSNLEAITQQENFRKFAMQSKPYKHNTSGIKGVNWSKSCNKWEAKIIFEGKKIHLGFFEGIKEAERAVVETRAKLYGVS